MKGIFLILIAWMILFSCSKREKPTIQPDVDRFFKVYQTFIDLYQAESSRLLDESVLMDSALVLHRMDPAQFDTTLAYLERHPDIFLQAFEQFDDSLRAKLNIRSID